jgi:hypothetical protein
MEHLSDWHELDTADRTTYPKVPQKVQIRFRNGDTKVGQRSGFFPAAGPLDDTEIAAWRYIKDWVVD